MGARSFPQSCRVVRNAGYRLMALKPTFSNRMSCNLFQVEGTFHEVVAEMRVAWAAEVWSARADQARTVAGKADCSASIDLIRDQRSHQS